MHRSTLKCILLAMAFCGGAVASTTNLVSILQSNASRKEKADACLELARVGGAEAVPMLAALLGDAELSHMARYALEPIPDPAVDEALRASLGTLKGSLLVGVINSIGVRRDGKAVPALAKLLADPGRDVASAAAQALGAIGSRDAEKALESALRSSPPEVRTPLQQAMLCVADTFVAQGQSSAACDIFDQLRDDSASLPIRMAAVRGAILARGKKGTALLTSVLQGQDEVMFKVGLRAAMELQSADVPKAVGEILETLAPERQLPVVQLLASRGDASAAPILEKAAVSGSTPLRMAAIQGLAQLGAPSSVPVLATLAASGAPSDVSKAAQAALAALPGGAADEAIVAMLDQKDPKLRVIAAELSGQRRVTRALPTLLRAAVEADGDMQYASLKALGELGGSAEIPALIEVLAKTGSAQAERAIAAVLARPATGQLSVVKAVYGKLPDGPSADVTAAVTELVKAGNQSVTASNETFGDAAPGLVKQLRVDYTVDGRAEAQTVAEGEILSLTSSRAAPAGVHVLCEALSKVPPAAKPAILRLLRSAGGAEALEAVRGAAAGADAATSEAALRTLCEWPTTDALPDLTRLAGGKADETMKILALRACLRLVPLLSGSAQERLAAVKQVLALAERDEEKRQALAVLGAIPLAESLDVIGPYFEKAELLEEACRAAVSIAAGLPAPYPPSYAATLQNVVRKTADKPLSETAAALLKKAAE